MRGRAQGSRLEEGGSARRPVWLEPSEWQWGQEGTQRLRGTFVLEKS